MIIIVYIYTHILYVCRYLNLYLYLWGGVNDCSMVLQRVRKGVFVRVLYRGFCFCDRGAISFESGLVESGF